MSNSNLNTDQPEQIKKNEKLGHLSTPTLAVYNQRFYKLNMKANQDKINWRPANV